MLLSSVSFARAADEGPIEPAAVAVYPVTWSGDSDRAWSEVQAIAQELGPLLSQSLQRDVGATVVLTEKDIDAVLTDETQKEMMACPDVSLCRAEIGAALGVQYALTGHVKKRRDVFSVTLELISTEDLVKVRSRSERTRYGQAAVMEASRQLVRRLFDPEAPTKMAVVTVKDQG
ncbi:MAG: hypothetical protein AAFX94_23425, partial [Myxococcota bacterium]